MNHCNRENAVTIRSESVSRVRIKGVLILTKGVNKYRRIPLWRSGMKMWCDQLGQKNFLHQGHPLFERDFMLTQADG